MEENNQLLDNYIQQVSDQQNQIGELQMIIAELKYQVSTHKKELIKKDIVHILEEEAFEIEDSTINEIVDYILERENNDKIRFNK